MSDSWINDVETAKEIILATLPTRYVGSIKDLINVAIIESIKSGRIKGDASTFVQYGVTRSAFDEKTWLMIDCAIWELFRQGILIPGLKRWEEGIDLYRISPFGRQLIESGQIDAFSKNRYLETLEAQAPDIDTIVKKYILEALATFQAQAYLATAVMIGCATERLVILLESAFSTYLKNNSSGESIKFEEERNKSKGIAGRREAIMRRLQPKIKTLLPDEEPKRFLKCIDGTFSLIGETRNEAGHPIDTKITPDEAALLLWQLKANIPKTRKLIIALAGENAWINSA